MNWILSEHQCGKRTTSDHFGGIHNSIPIRTVHILCVVLIFSSLISPCLPIFLLSFCFFLPPPFLCYSFSIYISPCISFSRWFSHFAIFEWLLGFYSCVEQYPHKTIYYEHAKRSNWETEINWITLNSIKFTRTHKCLFDRV